MSDAQLTALSTIGWIVGIVSVFVLLARWSDGGSWGISSAVARGLIGWAGRNGAIAGEWPSDDELGPIRRPELERLWASEPPPEAVSLDAAAPLAEIEDLGIRRLP